MDPLLAAFVLESVTLRRLVRVGACPVLEVRVSYPRLVAETEDARAARFNRAYRTMAEAYLAWAEGVPAAAIREEFLAAGRAAAYRFDRRMLLCDMQVAWPPEADRLTVLRTARKASRRGEVESAEITARDVWRWPDLTLCKPSRTPRLAAHGRGEKRRTGNA